MIDSKKNKNPKGKKKKPESHKFNPSELRPKTQKSYRDSYRKKFRRRKLFLN